MQKNMFLYLIIFVTIFYFNNVSADEQKIPIDTLQQNNIQETIPGPDDFTAAEKEPAIDISKLAKLVVYPSEALKNGIEGRVIIRLFVSKDGSTKNHFVEYSDDDLLNEAALDAVKSYGNLIPAIQKGQPIDCWLSVPISFKLRDPVTKEEE